MQEIYSFKFYLSNINGKVSYRNGGLVISDTSVYKIFNFDRIELLCYSNLKMKDTNSVSYTNSNDNSISEYSLFYKTNKPYLFDSIMIYRIDLIDTTKIKNMDDSLFGVYENNKLTRVLQKKELEILRGFCSMFEDNTSHKDFKKSIYWSSNHHKINIDIYRGKSIELYNNESNFQDYFIRCFLIFLDS
ncbi:MAG: hypothetical protein Q8K70_01210 [Bacteroidota bacterium]|nr:hypothetical protein [Bacteroidota bacterium]